MASTGNKPCASKLKLFLCGDVMTGRGIDQILPRPSSPEIYESYLTSAEQYIEVASITALMSSWSRHAELCWWAGPDTRAKATAIRAALRGPNPQENRAHRSGYLPGTQENGILSPGRKRYSGV